MAGEGSMTIRRSLVVCLLGVVVGTVVCLLGVVVGTAVTTGASDGPDIEMQGGPKATQPDPDGDIVHKTVFDTKMRLSFLVGLEGSGHHYLMKAKSTMFELNDWLDLDATGCIRCEPYDPYYRSRSIVGSPAAFTDAIEAAKGSMRDLAERGRALTMPGHIASLCEEESFPVGTGRDKVVHYPDVRLLAEVAEAEGVDLRLVYLKRSANDIIVANTIHRPFQTAIGLEDEKDPDILLMAYLQILITNAAVVHSSLGELDPAFVVCHDYAKAGEMEQASKVAEFVAPNPAVAVAFRDALVNTWEAKPPSNETLPNEGGATLIARLQRKLGAFESTYCSDES